MRPTEPGGPTGRARRSFSPRGSASTGLNLRMARGSVIAGVLVDQNGEPFSGATVNAMRNMFVGSGQRTLFPAASAQTDDRGQYRIWGLAAGDYVVSASVGSHIGRRDDADIARLTDADIKRAMSDIASWNRAPWRGTLGHTDRSRAPVARTVGYASVFYPGTSVAAQAIPIKLGVAEERSGVDFPLSLVPTARVEGIVDGARGNDAADAERTDGRQQPAGRAPRRVQTRGTSA